MPRPRPPLGPAHTLMQQLGNELRYWREMRGLTVAELAKLVGRDRRTISGAENGQSCPASAVMVQLEEHLQTRGLLLSSYAAVLAERNREKFNRPVTQQGLSPQASEEDASEFLGETVADGSIMGPGHRFEKTWTIRNVGTRKWSNRRLARIGIAAGRGLITTPEFIPVPAAEPGDELVLAVSCVAPFVQGTSLAAFKMVDPNGALYFPYSLYSVGLQVQVTVVERYSASTSPEHRSSSDASDAI